LFIEDTNFVLMVRFLGAAPNDLSLFLRLLKPIVKNSEDSPLDRRHDAARLQLLRVLIDQFADGASSDTSLPSP
jgi:hypothetical protein